MLFALAYSIDVGMIEAMSTKFGNVWLVRTIISFLMLAIIFLFYLRVNKRGRGLKERGLLTTQSTSSLVNFGIILRWELMAILAFGILTLMTTSLMGHGAAIKTGAQVPITIDFFHNLAALIWIGGVIYLALVLVPKFKEEFE